MTDEPSRRTAMIEDDLRDALRARASTYEVSPHAWLEVRRRAARSRRLRWTLLAAVPLATGAVLAGIPLVVTHGGPDAVTGATTAVSGEPTPTYKDAYAAGVAENPPIGETLTLVNPADGKSMLLWFARAKAKGAAGFADLCSATQLSSGGTIGSCAYDSRNPAHTGEVGWYVGGTDGMLPRPGKLITYGAARDAVTKVEAVADDGSRFPGTIYRPKGAPLAIWTVSYPAQAKLTAYELSGAGEKVLQRVKTDPMPVPGSTAEPVGPAAKLGGGVTARLHRDQSLVWRQDGKVVALFVVASTPQIEPGETLADALKGNRRPVMSRFTHDRWLGYARAGTGRVVLTFKDGTSIEADAMPDPWGGDAVLFSAPYAHEGDIYAEGYVITGYDRDGGEVWRDEAKPVSDLWASPAPGDPAFSGPAGQTGPPRWR
ncbi:hypothetical protein AB0B89_31325 [Sphaerisporangium sp. NPDC049002]|uniref:hypothetical protein n=1 Tax=unclassified Sphaerisporangium TaxID=2630420 RepID=UPI0033C01E78